MFDRFTDHARQVMEIALQVATRRGQNHIEPEDILLGLVELDCGLGVNVLKQHAINLDGIRSDVEQVTKSRQHFPQRLAKNVIESAIEEAKGLDQSQVGSEHILLGLLRFDGTASALVLSKYGLTLEGVREEILKNLRSTHAYD